MIRVAFLQDFWFEFIGPMYISAVLKREGYMCEMFMEKGEKDLWGSLVRFAPDIVGFSCSCGGHKWSLEMAQRLKETLKIVTVFGGPYATYYPDAIQNPAVDIICRGEGEEAMLDLVRRLEKNQDYEDIENLWIKRNGSIHKNGMRKQIEHLDDLPLPDRSLYYKYRHLRSSPNKHFITGRGCPYSCTFCNNKAYRSLYRKTGNEIRRHSVERVIQDIKGVRDRYGMSSVRFDDEVFTLDKAWASDFLEQYRKEIHLPFTCLIRADTVNSEIIGKLAEAGCHTAYFGVESGSERLRNEVLHKNISDAQLVSTAQLLRRHRIRIGTFNMVGIPGETIDDAMMTVRLNQKLKVGSPWCSILQPYPKTEVADIARRKGLLSDGFNPDAYSSSYFDSSLIMNPDRNKLQNLHKFFYLAVRVPSLTFFIKQLIKLPPNVFFNLVFMMSYGYRYMTTYKLSPWRIIVYLFKFKKHFH